MQPEIEQSVIEDIRSRREMGRRQYGSTMERTDIDLVGCLSHFYTELLDGAIYAKRLIRDLTNAPEKLDWVSWLKAHPEYNVVPQGAGYAIVHTTGEHGGLGAVRFADTLEQVPEVLAKMKEANGDT